MGHRFSVMEYEGDTEDPEFEASVAFFRTMKLKWAKYLMAKLAAGMLNDIDIYNERELVSWRVYLKIFSDIRQKIDEDVENEKRKMYHPSCRGFIMNPIDVPKDFEVETTDDGDQGPKDDYTEDAASEYSEDEDDEEESEEEESSSSEEESSEEDETDDEDEDEGEEGDDKSSKKKKKSLTEKGQGDDEEKGAGEQLALTDGVAGEEGSVAVGSMASIPNGLDGASSSVDSPDKSNALVKVAGSNESSYEGGSASGTTTVRSRTREWNAEIISPVFFGYTYVEEKQHDEAVAGEKAALRVAEERAVQRTKANRAQLLDEFEIAMKNQHANRVKKINKLQDEYDKARSKREEDLRRFQAELPPIAFNAYKATWELEYLTAEEAFDAEIGKMNDFHEKQCAADFETVQKRRDELEAFKDAESQDRPAAERLEEISRVELARWIDMTVKRGAELRKVRDDFLAVKAELEERIAAEAPLKELNEIRSVLNVAETTVRQAQKTVQEALDGMYDSEVLLKRAVRMRAEQKALLPLFILLAKVHGQIPEQIRLDLLACAVTALMDATFDQKMTFFFNVFDAAGTGYFTGPFIVRVAMLFGEMFNRLTMLPYPPHEEDLYSAVNRGFMDLGLSYEKDILTVTEAKRLLITFLSHSFPLANALAVKLGLPGMKGVIDVYGGPGGVPGGSLMGTYQRNRMTAVGLLMKGMIGPTVCKYRVHVESTRFRPQLDPAHIQLLHERAMQMGEEDPLRTDYSRYYARTKKGKKTVVALDLGHLASLRYQTEYVWKEEAAVKLQSMVRGRFGRKKALVAAKKAAYAEAKSAAVKEMKDRVLKEFKKRETSSNPQQKMKWDATVKMRQSKLRSEGQTVTRSDTVMLMIEEAMDRAKVDILAKFAKIEEKEDFAVINFGNAIPIEWNLQTHVEDTFARLFDIFVDRTSVKDKEKKQTWSIEEDGIEGETDEEFLARMELEQAAKAAEAKDKKAGKKKRVLEEPMVYNQLQRKRFRQAVEGQYERVHSNTVPGETGIESILRLAMSYAEVSKVLLLENRLRVLDSTMTLFKARQVLSENPSKRLLLRYIEATRNEETLSQDLSKHYNFKNAEKATRIARLLRSWVTTDFERGILIRDLRRMEDRLEVGLRSWVNSIVEEQVENMADMIDRRMLTTEDSNEAEILNSEITRVKQNMGRFGNVMAEILLSWEKLRDKSRRVLLSFHMVSRKLTVAETLKHRKFPPPVVPGVSTIEAPPVNVTMQDRQSWLLRMKTALKTKPYGQEETEAEALAKYEEVRSVCTEFLATATADAMIILAENFVPKYHKTIPVAQELEVKGRARFSGRGHDTNDELSLDPDDETTVIVEDKEETKDGERKLEDSKGAKSYVFESHNIIYRVCEDTQGVFNGSDEFAMKAGGNDLVGAKEYAKVHLDRLHAPLQTTVDYFGFRVLCVSKLPVERIIFTDDGDVRRISEQLVHGVTNAGDHFVNKSKDASSLLEMAASTLNLAHHEVRGLKDMAHKKSKTWCSSDLLVYRSGGEGGDGSEATDEKVDDFYMKNFWRCMPPESSEDTPHLMRAPRDQSIHWRLLRPELVRLFQYPLSPDAVNLLSKGAPDRDEQYEHIVKATRLISSDLVPNLMEVLIARDYNSSYLPLSEGFGLDFSTELHCRGINIRHIGLARSLLFRPVPGTVNMYFNESFIRTQRDLRNEVQKGEKVFIDGIEGWEFHLHESEPDDKEEVIFQPHRLPITKRYTGLSVNKATALVGALSSTAFSHELRAIMLGEMVARAVKGIIRTQLRNYCKVAKGVSLHFKTGVIVEYFNVVTGASARANEVLQEVLFESIKERFGPRAVRESERATMQLALEPVTIFVIKRLQAMLGLQLSIPCLAMFHEHPVGFAFHALDLLDVSPVVQHNMPMLPYAEAMTAFIAAQQAERDTYAYQVVVIDKAPMLLKLAERKGARYAENVGTLGKDFHAYYNRDNMLEKMPGPESADAFSRAAGFLPGMVCAVETKPHFGVISPVICSQYTVEVHARCMGGQDINRYLLCHGRFSFVANRLNSWDFVYSHGMHDVAIDMGPVVLKKWAYLAVTCDGVMIRCYVDSNLVASLEIEGTINELEAKLEEAREKERQDLDRQQEFELGTLEREIDQKTKAYFTSKEGLMAMREKANEIFEDPEFHEQDFNVTAKERLQMSEAQFLKVKKNRATKMAKDFHAADLFQRESRTILERYKALRQEIVEKQQKEAEEGEMRGRKPFRIGGPLNGSTNITDQNNNFNGDVGLVSAYPVCLSSDRIHAHYMAANSGKMRESQRLYALTSAKFEDALHFAFNDSFILKGYAHCLCAYLRAEAVSGLNKFGASGAKLKIRDAIVKFREINLPEGIGEIVLQLPKDPQYGDLVSFGFLTMKGLDHLYFSRGESLKRSDMTWLPQVFGLDHPRSPADYIAAAAGMYQEVCKDFNLHFVYADVDLQWLYRLTSPELVLAIVRAAQEDNTMRMLNCGEMFRASGRADCLASVTDDDVAVLTEFCKLTVGFDFAGCSSITNKALTYLPELKLIRALSFDNCTAIDNKGLTYLLPILTDLEVLSLAGLGGITDEGLMPIFSECGRLKVVSVSNCPMVTHVALSVLVNKNKMLSTLKCAAIDITDEGFALICASLSRKNFTSLDVSFCREITDMSIVNLAETCPNLKVINLCGLSRVADRGIKAVLGKCLALETVNFEDVFLFDEDAFWFDIKYDGRPVANQNMLTMIKHMNLRDCVCVTDKAVEGLADRCRFMEHLSLRGCHKITDVTLRNITLKSSGRFTHKTAMCETLKTLDLSFCTGITATALSNTLLPLCVRMEELHLSGVTSINDAFIHAMCKCCPSLQKLSLQKCIQITDVSLCSLAEHLWLEVIDLTGCYRITDDGLDVLTMACTGLQEIHLRRCSKIGSKGVICTGRNIRNYELRVFDIRDCPRVTAESVNDLVTNQPMVTIL